MDNFNCILYLQIYKCNLYLQNNMHGISLFPYLRNEHVKVIVLSIKLFVISHYIYQ